MASRSNYGEEYGRGSRSSQRRGRSEQQGYEEERWRRNQEWSPSQDTEYQTGNPSYGYGRSGRSYRDYSDADRFGSRSGDYPLGGGEGDFRSFQGGQGGFGTSQYGYGGTGSQRNYGSGPSLGGYEADEYDRRGGSYGAQGGFGGGYGQGPGAYGEGRYGPQGGYGSESGYNKSGSGGFQGEQFGSQSGDRSPSGQFGSQGGYGRSTGRVGEQQAGFRGRGPKGYTRSDQRIEEDVNERLSDDYYLDASDIEVSVQGGTVTLSGEVEDREAKRRAEDIAEFCSGVRQVQNNIKVKSGGLTGWLFGNGADESENRGTGEGSSSTQNTTSGASSKKASSGS